MPMANWTESSILNIKFSLKHQISTKCSVTQIYCDYIALKMAISIIQDNNINQTYTHK